MIDDGCLHSHGERTLNTERLLIVLTNANKQPQCNATQDTNIGDDLATLGPSSFHFDRGASTGLAVVRRSDLVSLARQTIHEARCSSMHLSGNLGLGLIPSSNTHFASTPLTEAAPPCSSASHPTTTGQVGWKLVKSVTFKPLPTKHDQDGHDKFNVPRQYLPSPKEENNQSAGGHHTSPSYLAAMCRLTIIIKSPKYDTRLPKTTRVSILK